MDSVIDVIWSRTSRLSLTIELSPNYADEAVERNDSARDIGGGGGAVPQ
jgi:hypothetical protein